MFICHPPKVRIDNEIRLTTWTHSHRRLSWCEHPTHRRPRDYSPNCHGNPAEPRLHRHRFIMRLRDGHSPVTRRHAPGTIEGSEEVERIPEGGHQQRITLSGSRFHVFTARRMTLPDQAVYAETQRESRTLQAHPRRRTILPRIYQRRTTVEAWKIHYTYQRAH